MSRMRRYKCPKCGDIQTVRADQVAHRCHYNKNKLTHYEVICEADPDTPAE